MGFNLTVFEKETLIDAIEDGFFFDDLDDSFITWGFTGKQERGAGSSMVQKGLISVTHEGGDTYVWSNIPKRQMLKMLNIYPELWEEQK